MAASPGARMIAEFILQRHIHRPGNVTGEIGFPTVGLVHPPPDIENRWLVALGHLPH